MEVENVLLAIEEREKWVRRREKLLKRLDKLRKKKNRYLEQLEEVRKQVKRYDSIVTSLKELKTPREVQTAPPLR